MVFYLRSLLCLSGNVIALLVIALLLSAYLASCEILFPERFQFYCDPSVRVSLKYETFFNVLNSAAFQPKLYVAVFDFVLCSLSNFS